MKKFDAFDTFLFYACPVFFCLSLSFLLIGPANNFAAIGHVIGVICHPIAFYLNPSRRENLARLKGFFGKLNINFTK